MTARKSCLDDLSEIRQRREELKGQRLQWTKDQEAFLDPYR